MKAKIILFILMFCAVTQINAAATHCSNTEQKELENSLKKYLNDPKNNALPYNEVTLSSKKCVNGYAKVILHPKKPVTDDATVYLQKQNSSWKVLNLGTAFDPEFLAKLPEALR